MVISHIDILYGECPDKLVICITCINYNYSGVLVGVETRRQGFNVWVGVLVGVDVFVDVIVGVGVGTLQGSNVGVGVIVGVGVGVWVLVIVGVGVGVGVGSGTFIIIGQSDPSTKIV